MKHRVILQAPLRATAVPAVAGLRPLAEADHAALASLLFDAYLGTVDQEEDTLEQAQIEIHKTVAGDHGVFLPACCRVVERSGALLSAALLTRFRGRPFIAFVITSPAHKSRGLARACVVAAMGALQAMGEQEVHLVVTLANAPAMHLYQSLGFQVERAL